MPYVIALTGGIGSGKSSVANAFADLGADIVDTDIIAHELTAAGQPGAIEIGRKFGAEILRPDGSLDRGRMRALVFADPAARKKLESILHPMIRARVHDAVRQSKGPYIILVVPLLVETGAYRELANRIAVVDCNEADQITRVMQRNGHTVEIVRSIMASQAGRANRLACADDVIINDSDIAALRAATTALHQRYLALATDAAAQPSALL